MKAWAAVLIPLALYALTLCPTTYVGDSGEMITIAWTLGVPQPTGFPLYCLLGKVATLWPGADPAVAVNALSALSTALTALAVYLLLAGRVGATWATVGALVYATGHTPWSQAVIARTYAPTQALVALQLVLLDRCRGRPGRRVFLALALLVGAGLGTHLLSILLVPSFGLAWLDESPRRKVLGLALVAVGLGLYAYLPLRSAATPYNVYGPVDTPQTLIDYLTQKRYRDKQFSRSPENLRAAVATLADHAGRQHSWPALLTAALALGGLGLLHRCGDGLGRPLVLGAALNVLILSGYGDNQDLPFLPRYFLFCWMAQAVCATVAAAELTARAGPLAFRPLALLVGVALCVNAVQVGSRCDRSRTRFPLAALRAVLDAPDGRTLVFLAGDAPILIADYVHFVQRPGRTARYLGVETFPSFVAGRPYPGPVRLTFVPRRLPPGTTLVHMGLSWEVVRPEQAPTAQALEARRAVFWRDLPMEGLETDPAVTDDYEAAALAGEIFFHRGLDWLEDGHPARARASFETARRVAHQNRLMMWSLARVYARAGWADEARGLVEQALVLDLSVAGRVDQARAEAHRELGL